MTGEQDGMSIEALKGATQAVMRDLVIGITGIALLAGSTGLELGGMPEGGMTTLVDVAGLILIIFAGAGLARAAVLRAAAIDTPSAVTAVPDDLPEVVPEVEEPLQLPPPPPQLPAAVAAGSISTSCRSSRRRDVSGGCSIWRRSASPLSTIAAGCWRRMPR